MSTIIFSKGEDRSSITLDDKGVFHIWREAGEPDGIGGIYFRLTEEELSRLANTIWVNFDVAANNKMP